jgi:hypothetical protein
MAASREWTGRLRRTYPALADLVLIVLIALTASAWLYSDTRVGPSAWLLAAALLLPLLLRRRAPLAAFALLVGVAGVQWLVGVELVADVTVLVALYTVAAQCSRRTFPYLHGLAGMSERVAAYGGSVTAGPGAESGWSVHATLRLNGKTP